MAIQVEAELAVEVHVRPEERSQGTLLSANNLHGNRGNGINIGGPSSPRRWLNNRIEGNTLTNTGRPETQFHTIGVLTAESSIVVGNRVIGMGRGPGINVSNSLTASVRANNVSRNTDGIWVSAAASSTTVQANGAVQNTDDGIDVDSPSTTIRGNVGAYNGDLGIEAVAGVTDGGRNRAAGNGNPEQCSPTIVCA